MNFPRLRTSLSCPPMVLEAGEAARASLRYLSIGFPIKKVVLKIENLGPHLWRELVSP